MSSQVPSTDLWLERSRLDGMLLSAVSYGIFFLLTIQATMALVQRQRHGSRMVYSRWTLLGYVWITFVLATIGFAGNARYTEMIWIDLRNTASPTELIPNEMNYWINMMALTCYYIMEWLMQALLLHRCFIFWNWQKLIVVSMSILYVAAVAMSILVLVEASGAVFYNINYQLAYLCLQVGLTIIYTLLVTGRLFLHRKVMSEAMGSEHAHFYDTVTIMIIESAVLYSVLGIIYMFSFAFHSNISNLVFLSVNHVQGIAQLLIIIRVARGRGVEQTFQTSLNLTPLVFINTLNQKDWAREPPSTEPSLGTERMVQP